MKFKMIIDVLSLLSCRDCRKDRDYSILPYDYELKNADAFSRSSNLRRLQNSYSTLSLAQSFLTKWKYQSTSRNPRISKRPFVPVSSGLTLYP